MKVVQKGKRREVIRRAVDLLQPEAGAKNRMNSALTIGPSATRAGSCVITKRQNYRRSFGEQHDEGRGREELEEPDNQRVIEGKKQHNGGGKREQVSCLELA